jgi:hypothetical protein
MTVTRTPWIGARWPRAYNTSIQGHIGRLSLGLTRGPAIEIVVGPSRRPAINEPALLRAWADELRLAADVLEHELALPRQDADGQMHLEVAR